MRNIKTYWWVIALLLVVVLIIFYKKNTKDLVCYDLPIDGTMDEIGPKYWAAIHDIVDRIPCETCRGSAVTFMSFYHDLVNKKLDKPLYNQENFNLWINKLKQEQP